MEVELNSFDSVRQFCTDLEEFKMGKPVDRLICNAAVYQPSLPYAKWSADGHEQQMQINFLSHFLLVSLLLADVARAPDPRIIMVGSVTGNDNTVGGGGGTQCPIDSRSCPAARLTPPARSPSLPYCRPQGPCGPQGRSEEPHLDVRRVQLHRRQSVQGLEALPHDDLQHAPRQVANSTQKKLSACAAEATRGLHAHSGTTSTRRIQVPQADGHRVQLNLSGSVPQDQPLHSASPQRAGGRLALRDHVVPRSPLAAQAALQSRPSSERSDRGFASISPSS